jgi:DNA repair photolyase
LEYGWTKCKSALYSSRLPELDYALNPYIGCEHGCTYCYSRALLRSRELAKRWGSFVWAKQRLLDRLRVDLRRKPKGIVGVGTATDPYQPLEGKLKLTEKCLRLILNYQFNASIQTKSTLVLRDLEIISAGKFDVGVTVITLNEDLAKILEPRAPPPKARLKTLEKLSEAEIETWLFYGPIIPGLNDDEETIAGIVKEASRAGCQLLFYDKLNLKTGVLESLSKALNHVFPDVVKSLPESLSKHFYWNNISRKIEEECRKANIRCKPAFAESKGFKLANFQRKKGKTQISLL